jgi:hypothetical protein
MQHFLMPFLNFPNTQVLKFGCIAKTGLARLAWPTASGECTISRYRQIPVLLYSDIILE